MANATNENNPSNRTSFALTRKTRAGGCAAMLLLLCAPLSGNSPGFQKATPPSLTAAQVVDGIVRMNLYRAESLRDYTSVRRYHLELNGIIHLRSDMVARMTYHWPDQKSFTIISESGSEIMRSRVLKALLEAEKESMQTENRKRTALSPENYDFALLGLEGTPRPTFYVLSVTPKLKNKFLFKGKVWVDARDFAVVRIECEPAKNPSWWTKKNDIKYNYQKIGDFWLPARTESVTEVRVFGRAVLTIEYQDYHLIETRELPTEFRKQESGKALAAP